eukprot:m.114714 g.114714  ORF g.114714 m.114714 type:complete len:354 (-) comp28367_c0_seq1:405-1466(-)
MLFLMCVVVHLIPSQLDLHDLSSSLNTGHADHPRAPTSRCTPTNALDDCLGFVAKRTFSSKSRAVFIAGLEGTGHHAFHSLFTTDMCDYAETVGDAINKKLTKHRYCVGVHPEHLWPTCDINGSFFLGQRRSDVLASRVGLLKAFKRMANARRKRLFVLNGAHPSYLNWPMLSYPNCAAHGCRNLHNPDVRMLADVAEQAGLDLRVIVITRSAQGMLESVIVNRGFGETLESETNLLSTSAAILTSQLKSIDPLFVSCIATANGQLGDVNVWNRTGLSDTLMADVDTTERAVAAHVSAFDKYMRSNLQHTDEHRERRRRKWDEESENVKVAVRHLQIMLGPLHRQCPPSRSVV